MTQVKIPWDGLAETDVPEKRGLGARVPMATITRMQHWAIDHKMSQGDAVDYLLTTAMDRSEEIEAAFGKQGVASDE